MSGILSGAGAWSPTDLSNPAIRQYRAELKAARQPSRTVDLTTVGVNAWAAVHLIADALQGSKQKTSAALVKRLNTKGAVTTTKYGLPPIDFTKPAFPEDPVLSKFRLFTRGYSVWRFNAKGVPVPLSRKWLDVTKRMNIK